jgi:hypothetical protein
VIEVEESSFSFASVVGNVMQDEDGVPKNAQVEGHVDFGEERKIDFVGRLDGQNGNSLLYENVQLTFSDGTTPLVTFLLEQLTQVAVTAKRLH